MAEEKSMSPKCAKCNDTGFTNEFPEFSKTHNLSIFCVCDKGIQETIKFNYKGEIKERLEFLKQTDKELVLGWLGVIDDKAYICWTLSLGLKYHTIKIETVGDYWPVLTKFDEKHLEAEIS